MPKFKVSVWHTVMDIVAADVIVEAEHEEAALAAVQKMEREDNLEFQWKACADVPESAYEEGYDITEIEEADDAI